MLKLNIFEINVITIFINFLLITFTLSDKNFQSVPTTVKTFENDTVLLPCYHNSPIRHVKWIRDNEILVDSQEPELSLPGRIKLWSNGSLQVNFVKMDDTGDYICEVITSSGLARQEHAIEVQYPASVKSVPSGVIEVNLGTTFEIVCDATGIPQPIISWKIKGQNTSDKLENQSRLLIDVENRELAGLIQCVATNGVGEPAIDGINMIVMFAPEVKAVKNIVHTKITLRAILECYSTASPSATVHWFRRGIPVTTNNQISRVDTEMNSNRTIFQYYSHMKHSLIIRSVRDTDLGLYECRIDNKIGFNKSFIELTGRPMPSIFKQSSIISESMAHNLIWQTESLSPIIEYLLKFRQIPSGNITPNNRYFGIEWKNLTIPADMSEGTIHTIGYTLRGLLPASVYEVAVKSRNRYGWSEISKIIRFATGGEINSPNYSTETIEYDELGNGVNSDLSQPTNFYEYPSISGCAGVFQFNYLINIIFIFLIVILRL